MSITLQDIAERTGVSASTVSRVLNRKGAKYRISAETEKQILKVAQELRYRPNQIASGLRLRKTYTVGLIAPDISNPFFALIIKRIQHALHSTGYSLVVCNTDESVAQEVEQVGLLFRKRVDGLIAMPVGQRSDHFREWLDRGHPLVLLDRCFSDLEANSVVVDNYSGAFEAVSHLIGLGHRRIAIIQGLRDTSTNIARLEGYRDALRAHGLPYDDHLAVGSDFRQENGYIEMKMLLSLDPPPTAVFATSDLITLGALKALHEEHVEVPTDLSLVMFDDTDFAPYLRSPLTAVRQPKEMMGEMAVKLLVGMFRHEDEPVKRIVLKPRLIVRESTAPPPGLAGAGLSPLSTNGVA